MATKSMPVAIFCLVIREGESVWVHTDSIMHTRLDRDAEFCPDAIRATDK